jgi:hypothetical protein
MLTYQLQRRNFKIADNAPWKFPNDVEIEMWFEPQEPFRRATRLQPNRGAECKGYGVVQCE